MNNKKINELKNAFNSINCRDEVDKIIMTKIHRKTKTFKPALEIMSILLVGIVTISVVNAEEITKKLYNFFVTTDNKTKDGSDITFKDSSRAVINYDANVPECGNIEDNEYQECYETYSKQEIENMLNIKILSNPLFTTNRYKLLYSIKNAGKIAAISLQLAEDITDDSKINHNHNFNIYSSYVLVRTKYDTRNDILMKGGTHKYETYHINNLNEDALILKSAGQTTFVYNVEFIHKNIIYSYRIIFKGSVEQNPDDICKKFLESFTEE